jgi:hypothetical protein
MKPPAFFARYRVEDGTYTLEEIQNDGLTITIGRVSYVDMPVNKENRPADRMIRLKGRTFVLSYFHDGTPSIAKEIII